MKWLTPEQGKFRQIINDNEGEARIQTAMCTSLKLTREKRTVFRVLLKVFTDRGGVEDTRLEAKGTKKIRGQGQGQPFRGQTLSRPRTEMFKAKGKNTGASVLQKKRKLGQPKKFLLVLELRSRGFYVQAYADDLAVLAGVPKQGGGHIPPIIWLHPPQYFENSPHLIPPIFEWVHI